VTANTPAIKLLQAAKIAFRVVEYEFDHDAGNLALHAAKSIGLSPHQVFKTLMVEAAQRPACVIIPADRSVSMKRVAQALSQKSAEMMPTAVAERVTGYRVGGISPFGQKQKIPMLLDQTAMECSEVAVNGGRRGLIVVLSPDRIKDVVSAKIADLCA